MAPGIRGALLDREAPSRLFASVDVQMVALMRCVLAAAALIACWVDTHQTPVPRVLFASLAFYAVYSFAVCIANFRGVFVGSRAHPWIDVVFYAYVVALTGGMVSTFFQFFFFAIVAAAFSRGFREGLGVTMLAVLSAVATSLVSYAVAPQPELEHAAWRSVSLFIIGYIISYWGGNDVTERRRLRLLRELGHAAKRQPTVDSLVGSLLERVLRFFRADSVLVIVWTGPQEPCRLYRAHAGGSTAFSSEQVASQSAHPLLALPRGTCISFHAGKRLLGGPGDPEQLDNSAREVANLLEARSFASVPFQPNERIGGRLYLLSQSRRFGHDELEFLAHVAAQSAAFTNDAMLTQELAQTAARQERSKISRDIHDTTVQSYIGLKLGLEALYRDIGQEATAGRRIKELLEMATLTADDLRRYVNRLRERESQGESTFLAKLEEQRRRYEAVHGIKVDVRADTRLGLAEPASGEVYQVVCEALSNIVRHTVAKHASVDLRRDGDNLAIEVANDRGSRQTAPFIPRSITERAMSLGGNVQVRLNNEGHDVVRVTIPVPAQITAGSML